ncbi:MAG: hypothetical protein Q9173_000037 [Seirophora scorigena]
MGPRDTRDSTETNGNVYPGKKGNGKAKISRASSNASLGDLTPEAVDTGIAAVRQIAKILRFAQGYHKEIGDVEVANLAFRKDQEMAKLQDGTTSTKPTFANGNAIKDGKTKEMEISRAKREFSDQSNPRVKQIREELEKKVQALETEKDGFKDTTKELEEKNLQAKKDLKKQKESFELDKRSSQSHIMRLESELNQINPASMVSSQTPEF